jgi:hypothetical protein
MDVREWLRSLADLVIRAGVFWAVSVAGVIGGIAAAVIGAIQQASATDNEKVQAVLRALDLVWPLLFLGGIPIALLAAYHGLREEMGVLAAKEDARSLAGTVEITPVLGVVGHSPDGSAVLRPLLKLDNKGPTPVMYAVQRFDVRLETQPRRRPKSAGAPASDQTPYVAYGEDDGPVHAYMISPDAYMSPTGPGPFIGPYAFGNHVDAIFEVEIRLGRPFSGTAIVEHRSFSLTTHLERNKKDGQVMGHTPVFGASASMLEWVPSNIINEGIEWPTLGSSLPPEVRSLARDPRDEYQDGK